MLKVPLVTTASGLQRLWSSPVPIHIIVTCTTTVGAHNLALAPADDAAASALQLNLHAPMHLTRCCLCGATRVCFFALHLAIWLGSEFRTRCV